MTRLEEEWRDIDRLPVDYVDDFGRLRRINEDVVTV